MTKVMFLMNGAKPARGGEFLTSYLITHLRKDLFRPTLVYANEGVIVQEIKKHGIDSIHLQLSDRLTNIYLREIKIYNFFFIFSFLWRVIAGGYVIKLIKLLKNNEIDLIYCADNLSKLLGGVAGKIAGIRVVAHCHDDFKEDALGKTMRIFYLLLLDRILTVSDKVRNFFLVSGKISQKVITVYNGINAHVFNPQIVGSDMKMELGLKKDVIVVGSMGVLEKDKGHKYLFEAISKLKSEGIANIACVVCGTGPEEENLKRFVYEKGIANTVLFLGYRNDIPKILKILDMIVTTSLTIEACPLSVIEAMSMEVPVIATNISGLPEIVDDGKTGILVPPGNIDALSNAIKYLIKNQEIRLAMGKNGRQRVLEKFTIEENVRKTEEVFLQLIRD